MKSSSEESDDEPLAKFAAAKKTETDQSDEYIDNESDIDYEPRSKKKKKKPKIVIKKKSAFTITLAPKLKIQDEGPVVQRPHDVWLYLKDLNPAGPYSCLLCPKLFVSKLRIMGHYMLDHKKYYCGICRYIVVDAEAWEAHLQFHEPWPCSQCNGGFNTELELKHHLSTVHNLVNCRICHFMLPDDEQYHTHLLRKHNVSNIKTRNEDVLWDIEKEGKKFSCLLCSKSKIKCSHFFNHFTGYHHFTLKCLATLICGKDVPFTVIGAHVTAEFMHEFQFEGKCGYVELDKNKNSTAQEADSEIPKTVFVEVKHEVLSETEDVEENKSKDDLDDDRIREIKSYKGEEDFDITMTELIILQSSYYDYICQSFTAEKEIPLNSEINYEVSKTLIESDPSCCFCPPPNDYKNLEELVHHMNKMHSVKVVPNFVCRLCVATFDTQIELDSHSINELGEFRDLWICQFCEGDFDGRVSTRKHLSEHWEELNSQNCFSPHLGFKCKFCPMLFWNEPEREKHHVEIHFKKEIEQFYKCECDEVFGDKVWFTHHYFDKHYKEGTNQFYLIKCCICAIVLKNVEQMRKHFLSEHPDAKKVYCSLETCQFRPLCHKKSFQLHLKSKHIDGAKRQDMPCTCNVCGQQFPNSRSRSAHVAHIHSSGRFRCKLCGESLQSMDERKLHYLLRHPGHHPFKCVDCGKSFQYKSSLYMHRKEHTSEKIDFTCHVCHKTFTKKDSFREHLMIHEGPQYSCSYCPRRFVQRSNMLRHERRHTGERPYSCPHCERAFSDKGACSSHIKHHHAPRETFPCEYCHQTFSQKTKLNYHLRRHTGENLETCTICSKVFTSACSLREHMKTHTRKAEEPVPCPLCKKEFQGARCLIRHVRVTHAGDTFICPICGKSLTAAAGLRAHVVTHADTNIYWCKLCPKSYAVKRTMSRHLRRWHGMKNPAINVREFYRKLDPRECNLQLDEELMTAIFGPKRNKPEPRPIGDIMSFASAQGAQHPNQAPPTEEYDEGDDEDDEGDEEVDDETKESDDSEIEEKYRPPEHNQAEDQVLEPTDFVSIKIEPIEEEY